MESATSKSAPQVKVIAALIKHKFPHFTPAAIASAHSTTASLSDRKGEHIMAQRTVLNSDICQSPAIWVVDSSMQLQVLNPGLIFDIGMDRISNLPDSLLTHILSYLVTKDSVRTSVLSKRWKPLWLSVPVLDLNCNDYPPYGEVPRGTACYIDTFLQFNHNNGSRLQKFKIQYDETSDYREYFVVWIKTVVERGIQHLDVESLMDRCGRDFMTEKINSSKTLVSLKLANVGMSDLDPGLSVFLPCLKIMHLDDIWYDDDHDPLFLEKLISGCPVLEDLALILPFDHCEHHQRALSLRVRSQTLKSFLFSFAFNTRDIDFAVEIDAPKLEYMDFSDDQSDRIVVKNLTSLSMIHIDTEFNVEYGRNLHDLSKRDVIGDFLTGISSVRHMIISNCTLKVLFQYSKLGPIPKFDNLHRLQAAISSSRLQLLPAFLESFPNLKNLILDFSVSREIKEIKLSHVPQCLILKLECVEIKLKVIMVEETVKELVKYFLENSVVLKKLILCFKDSSKANQDSDIFKELSTFTKLSPSCQIIIH